MLRHGVAEAVTDSNAVEVSAPATASWRAGHPVLMFLARRVAASGRILLRNEPLPASARRRTTEQRRQVQLVFQNPADAVNPRHTVEFAVGRPARTLRGLTRAQANAEVTQMLEAVRLPARVRTRYPAELSGGERQRVAIARALATQPELLICDEVTSALDVSVHAAVPNLLGELREELDLAILFISHHLGVVAAIADEVLVLEHGHVCERGSTNAVLRAPTQPYTQRLLEAAPGLSVAIAEWDASTPTTHAR
jgi:peptide/nickel transport system ATP-binding protein